MDIISAPFNDLLSFVVDNRGRTCPTSEIGFPLIATNCVSNQALYPSKENIRYVDKNTYNEWFRAHPKPNDILFVLKGSPGRCALVPDPVDFCIAQDMVALRANKQKIYPNYLFAALRSPLIQDAIDRMHVGTMIPHFKKGDFSKLSIPLPHKNTQKFIGDIYMEFEKKIDLNRRTNETLEAMARALFRDWFVDFGPTRAKMAGQTPYLAPKIWELFPDRLDDEGKPEGWKTAAFSQFVSILTGGTPKTSVADYWDGDIPWFSVVDTPAEGDIYVFDTAKKITKDGLNHSAAAILPEDTVIITARGTVGKLAMTHGPMTMNQSCYGLRGANGIGQYFVYQSIKNSLSEIRNNTHGSVFDTITRQTFSSICANLPSPEIVQNYEKMVAPFFQKALENVRQTQHLAQLRDLLLPKLMSGEIRIRDAEKMVGDAL